MSIADAERLDRRCILAACGFIAILLLSVTWPTPVVAINDLLLHREIAVDDLSFLGREALSWDVVYWCIVGIYALALFHPAVAEGSLRTDGLKAVIAEVPQRLRRRARSFSGARIVAAVAVAAGIVVVVWIALDATLTRWAEAVQSDELQSVVRLANRAGGGMNPAMVALFFLFAGMSCRRNRWIRYAVAMAIGGLGCGIAIQIMKVLVGRTRPELWLGPFQHARAAATSFPSGHTVGAFAIGGVLIFGSRSRLLQIVSALLAASIGLSRILVFRHWTSDVVASAILGLGAAWICTTAIVRDMGDEASSPEP
jgi:membrane-associated phospholipid phosphatase